VNPEIKQEWLAELRSGKYRQGKNALRRRGASGDTFCCLGVLCNILTMRPAFREYLRWADEPRGAGEIDILDEFHGDDELGVIPDMVRSEIGLDKNLHDELATLNDDGAGFEYIADVIEEQA
jgi:hypothetical protein